MKKYIKPNTSIVIVENSVNLMQGSKEPEITENIGAKEINTIFDWEDDEFGDLWEDDTDIEVN